MSLVELASRVEALEVPDRTIDCAIFATVRPGIFGDDAVMYARLDWTRNRGDWLWLRDQGMPAYTASLDAAMTLVPDGWEWTLFHGGVVSLKPDVAFCRHRETDAGTRADAATPALALTAAALRTMIAKAVEDGECNAD